MGSQQGEALGTVHSTQCMQQQRMSPCPRQTDVNSSETHTNGQSTPPPTHNTHTPTINSSAVPANRAARAALPELVSGRSGPPVSSRPVAGGVVLLLVVSVSSRPVADGVVVLLVVVSVRLSPAAAAAAAAAGAAAAGAAADFLPLSLIPLCCLPTTKSVTPW